MSEATTGGAKHCFTPSQPAFARVEPLEAHLLSLTVDRLHRATIGSDSQLVAPVMRAPLPTRLGLSF